MGRPTTRKAKPAKAAPLTVAEILDSLPIPIRELVRDLHKLIQSEIPAAQPLTYGGAKVRLILYSIGDAANVLCGISPCLEAGCLLYLHHVSPSDSEILEITGKGKHARHVRLEELTRSTKAEIRRLLALAVSRASRPGGDA